MKFYISGFLLFIIATCHGQTFQDFLKKFPEVKKPAIYSIYHINDSSPQVDTNDFKQFILKRIKKSYTGFDLNLNKVDEQNILHILCQANEQDKYSDMNTELTPRTYSFRYFNKIKLNDTLTGLVFIKVEQAYELGKINYDLFVLDKQDSIKQYISLGYLEANAMEGISYCSSEITGNQLSIYFHIPQFYMDYGIENKTQAVIKNDTIAFTSFESTGLSNYGAYMDTATKEAIILTFTPKLEIFYKNSKNIIYRLKVSNQNKDEFIFEFEKIKYLLKYDSSKNVWNLFNLKTSAIQRFEDIVPLQHNQYLKQFPDWFPYFNPLTIK